MFSTFFDLIYHLTIVIRESNWAESESNGFPKTSRIDIDYSCRSNLSSNFIFISFFHTPRNLIMTFNLMMCWKAVLMNYLEEKQEEFKLEDWWITTVTLSESLRFGRKMDNCERLVHQIRYEGLVNRKDLFRIVLRSSEINKFTSLALVNPMSHIWWI